jgi:hypothetical protein
MQPQSASQAYQDIVTFIKAEGSPPTNWHSGVTCDWANRIFIKHNVAPWSRWVKVCQCLNCDDAKAVGQQLGTMGCDCQGCDDTDKDFYVYAYRNTRLIYR